MAQVKWRCITRPESPSTAQSDSPVDNPLLTTYRQLLATGVACHWRIVRHNNNNSSSHKTLNDNTVESIDSTTDMMAVDNEPTSESSTTTAIENTETLQHELWLFWWGQEEPALSVDVEQTGGMLIMIMILIIIFIFATSSNCIDPLD